MTQKEKVIAFAKAHGACSEGLRAFKRAKGTVRQIFTRWYNCTWNGSSYGSWAYLKWIASEADIYFWGRDWLNKLIKRVAK